MGMGLGNMARKQDSGGGRGMGIRLGVVEGGGLGNMARKQDGEAWGSD